MEMIPYDLIALYLSRNAQREEINALEAWLAASEENRQVFQELQGIWLHSAIDPEKMRMEQEKTKQIVMKRARMRRWRRWAGIVGSAAALLIAGFFARGLMKPVEKPLLPAVSGEVILSTPPGQKSEAVLPDGTHIWLHSGTTISYPTDYGLTERIVELREGEAFFDVSHREGQKFLLKTASCTIRVHGTRFDVDAYQGMDNMSVVLEKGALDVITHEGKILAQMVPDQKLVLNHASGQVNLTTCQASEETSWRNGELKIEEAGIQTVIHSMEKWYGVEIALEGKVHNDHLYWMTIKTESLREMLDILNQITPIRYTINGRHVTINVL